MALSASNKNPYWEKSGENVVFSFRIDKNVYDLIKQVSEAEGRSVNAQLLRFVESGLIDYLETHENQ